MIEVFRQLNLKIRFQGSRVLYISGNGDRKQFNSTTHETNPFPILLLFSMTLMNFVEISFFDFELEQSEVNLTVALH